MFASRRVSFCFGVFAALSPSGCGDGSSASTKSDVVASVELAATSTQAVYTQHNNPARTGATLAEITLNTTNVKAGFGRRATLPVGGSVTAQPLFVPNLNVRGVVRNVVFVATLRNLVYAFAADGSSSTPLWGPVSLGPSIQLPDAEIGNGGYSDIAGEVGIISTPVISPLLNALFVVAATKESGQYIHRLHRLDLSTGAAQHAPVQIAATDFKSERQNQRSSLLLSNNAVYVAFASYGDRWPYYGWVFSYDAGTLAKRASYQTTLTADCKTFPFRCGGGIWMAGQGPAADGDGNIYVISGNGAFYPAARPNELSTKDLGNSFIKLNSSLVLSSWFSPSNNDRLNREDGDLGSSGPLLIPDTTLLLGAGKESRMFLLQRGGLGYFSSNDAQAGVAQRFFVNSEACTAGLSSAECHHVHGSPVYWNGPNGPWIYVWPENDYLKAFRFDAAQQRIDCRGAVNPECTPISQSVTIDPDGIPGGSHGMPGGFLSISADRGQAGSGIVWGLHPYTGNANNAVVPGVMRAYDASNLSNQLWDSHQNSARDDVGPFAKSAEPTIADGRVYVPSFTGMSQKFTLNESSRLSLALATGPSGRLYLGWTGTNSLLNVMSTVDGASFSLKATLSDTSHLGPALCGNSSSMYLGWIGTDGRLNVMRTTSSQFSTFTRMAEVVGGQSVTPPPETSNSTPGLALGNGRVFVAWTGTDGRLNVMSGVAGGNSFDGGTKVTLNESSNGAPQLHYANSRLYLTWTGTDGRLNIAYSSNDGATFAAKQTLDETSNVGAALVSRGSDLFVLWSGTDGGTSLNLRSSDGGLLSNFKYKLMFTESSAVSAAITNYSGTLYLAWRGNDSDGHLNIARYNPGSIGVYGLL